jgi:cytoskeletal protein CcmA (bactofilin family)
MVRHDPDTSVLGPGTRVAGRISGEGGISIEGNVRGDVSVTGPAHIATGASLEGNLRAESLEVGGTLTGDVVTQGPIIIRSGAAIRGELSGTEVSIEAGSRVSVRLNTEFELDLSSLARRK